MRTLQKTFTTQSTQQSRKLQNYSNITKLDHEHRERGFQVFISGANKERLKLQDLQGKTLCSNKTIVNNNNTLQRKNKPPNKEFAKRKIWQKNSNIEIKQNDGSKFVFSNSKPSKLGNNLSNSILHDITSKNIELHSSIKNNLQLNDIRNRYKAYFHIDGHGFCYSKNLSKPSTPIRNQIDKTSPIYNRKILKHLNRIQARPISSSCSSQPYNIEEQQSEYYSLLNKNKKCMNDLQKLLTPNCEYFQNCAKEGNIHNSQEDITKDVNLLDLYNGIDYDVFYHKEQIICRSAQALLLNKVLNESSFKDGDENEKELRSDYNNETSTNILKSQYDYDHEPCSRPNISFCKLKEIGNESSEYDERALVLLNNYKVPNEFILGNKENKENDCLPPLEKALSPISQLVKSSTNEKKRCLITEKQCIFNQKDTNLCNDAFDIKLPSRHIDNEYKSTLKLNLKYICQDLNSKFCDMKKLDMLQSNSCDEESISSNNNESSRTIDYSTTSSTPSNTKISPKWISHYEHKNLKLPLEKTSNELEDVDIEVDNNNTSSIFHNKHLRIENFSKKNSPYLKRKLLNARVQKLNIKKQIYLSHILDRLEIAHVSRSVDFYCHLGLQGIGREDRLST